MTWNSNMDEAPEPLTDAEKMQLSNLLIALKQPSFAAEYTNWRGEKSVRRLEPSYLWYGSTEYHPEPCLLLRARDPDKDALRDFKLDDFDLSTMHPLPAPPQIKD